MALVAHEATRLVIPKHLVEGQGWYVTAWSIPLRSQAIENPAIANGIADHLIIQTCQI